MNASLSRQLFEAGNLDEWEDDFKNRIWIASVRKSSRKPDQASHSLDNTLGPRYSGQLTKTTEIQYIMDSEDKFEWDTPKAANNYAKHGISFGEAKGVFRDTLLLKNSMIEKTTVRSVILLLVWLGTSYCSLSIPNEEKRFG